MSTAIMVKLTTAGAVVIRLAHKLKDLLATPAHIKRAFVHGIIT